MKKTNFDFTLAAPAFSDFDFRSYDHGVSHTLRVMRLVLHLGKVLKLHPDRVVAPAFCAAVIHDMARTHDGACNRHGEWAVEGKLPLWKDRFVAWGLQSEHLASVAAAIEWHCKPTPLHADAVTRLLKDADALDRVRFLWPDAVDERYLHYPETIGELYYAQRLHDAHVEASSWVEVFGFV
jgi:hypothetical protein